MQNLHRKLETCATIGHLRKCKRLFETRLIIEAAFHVVESWTTRHDFERYINKFEIPMGFKAIPNYISAFCRVSKTWDS